jgi:hypothetical protein
VFDPMVLLIFFFFFFFECFFRFLLSLCFRSKIVLCNFPFYFCYIIFLVFSCFCHLYPSSHVSPIFGLLLLKALLRSSSPLSTLVTAINSSKFSAFIAACHLWERGKKIKRGGKRSRKKKFIFKLKLPLYSTLYI